MIAERLFRKGQAAHLRQGPVQHWQGSSRRAWARLDIVGPEGVAQRKFDKRGRGLGQIRALEVCGGGLGGRGCRGRGSGTGC